MTYPTNIERYGLIKSRTTKEFEVANFFTQENLIKSWIVQTSNQITPENIPQSLIAFIENMDAISDDGKGDFYNFIQRAIKHRSPIILRPNIKRKPYLTAAGQSCQVAQELRRVIEPDYRGEIRTLVYGHKQSKVAGLVIVHIPHHLKVDNKAIRALSKNYNPDIISFSPNQLDARGKPETMRLNNIQYLANGLFNPYAINADRIRRVVHVFDSSLMDMETGICSTNASSRAVGQFFNPRKMTQNAIKIYQLPKYHVAIIADIARYNLSET
ncbi:MAG: hypothetical protein F6J93_00710 [Oscillatoria sp. SIO1A7]|nr:hypothetical protein [Oscillatoria sp. SIO1A7]